ncbi:hypothetical protein FOA52_004673 [Chlamydomonas sp. UWO 241]|nr:hypothetical protein FOA52_004673 [Chlamydomonas sp. UWO 241]
MRHAHRRALLFSVTGMQSRPQPSGRTHPANADGSRSSPGGRGDATGGRSGTSGSGGRGPHRGVPRGTLPTARGEALRQLMRVECEGAFAGRVGGPAPGTTNGSATAGQATRQPPPKQASADVDDDDDDAAEGADIEQAAGSGRSGGGGGAEFSPREQRLVKELVSGTVRWKRRLDYVISKLTGNSVEKLEPAVLQILRLGVFELTHRNVPGHSLKEHVELVKGVAKPHVTGFVNGVLRAAAKARDEGTLPDPEAALQPSTSGRDLTRTLAIAHSHPNWMVSRWLKAFGREGTIALMQHNNRPPVHGLRANQLRGMTASLLLDAVIDLGARAEASTLLPGSFVRIEAGLQGVLAEGLLSNGSASVQDEAAGLAVALLDPRPGETILDCCAAPGGKALFAADRMDGQGNITALDVSSIKLRALARAAQAAGASDIVSPVCADLRAFAAGRVSEGGPLFDKVLLDAPCSGTGVLSKRADMRWRRTPEQLDGLVALQDELLDAAASLVRPGGSLVYSTCSVEAEECGDRVAAFLARAGPRWARVPPAVGTAAAAHTAEATGGGSEGGGGGGSGGFDRVPASVVTPEGYVLVLPHVHGTDGAFAARLVRAAE